MEFTILLHVRHYIINNLHRGVIDAYETLVGLMNSAKVQHMKHIMILILIMLTISPTTADCERDLAELTILKPLQEQAWNRKLCLVVLELRLMVLIL